MTCDGLYRSSTVGQPGVDLGHQRAMRYQPGSQVRRGRLTTAVGRRRAWPATRSLKP